MDSPLIGWCGCNIHGNNTGILPMDIASITSSAPVSATAMSTSKSTENTASDNGNNSVGSYQPPAPPPLPPGQGVRVDQLA